MNLEVRTPEEAAQSATFRARVGGFALGVIGVLLAGGGVERLTEGKIGEGVVSLLSSVAAISAGLTIDGTPELGHLAGRIRHHLSSDEGSARTAVSDFLAEAEASGRSTAD